LSILGGLYGRAAVWRRAWYERDPRRRRQLTAPVISVGNLVVGGSGKTPTVAALARLLLDMGERPAILSRGYGRRDTTDGVVVVSDGNAVLEPAARSGDEPQMLARALPRVPVLVASERYLAGAVAERRFGATVHLLDDGFQHLPLARDVDLLIVSRADLDESLLPGGRLREPLATARRADALLVPGGDDDARVVGAELLCDTVFRLAIEYEPLESHGRRAVAVAGIARPERFFAALRAQGVDVVESVTFRDHHWFTPADVERVTRIAAAAHVDLVVTTEKDAMRLETLAGDAAGPPAWTTLKMRMTIEPRPAFADWLGSRVQQARVRRGDAA
jgi:tetraacyldisaccharide 4'-kinase